VKERLRLLLKEREPSKIRWRLADFCDAAIDAQMPETTRLAKTIEASWPAILIARTQADRLRIQVQGQLSAPKTPLKIHRSP
jgi:hypothetical protein